MSSVSPTRSRQFLGAVTALLTAATVGGPAQAAGYVPDLPSAGLTAKAAGSASILAPAAAPALVAPISADRATAAVDGEGRSLSVSVPKTVTLYGLARGDAVAARAVITPKASGPAQLGLALDAPVRNAATAGAYVGVLPLSLDYN